MILMMMMTLILLQSGWPKPGPERPWQCQLPDDGDSTPRLHHGRRWWGRVARQPNKRSEFFIIFFINYYYYFFSTPEFRNAFLKTIRQIIRDSVRRMNLPVTTSQSYNGNGANTGMAPKRGILYFYFFLRVEVSSYEIFFFTIFLLSTKISTLSPL